MTGKMSVSPLEAAWWKLRRKSRRSAWFARLWVYSALLIGPIGFLVLFAVHGMLRSSREREVYLLLDKIGLVITLVAFGFFLWQMLSLRFRIRNQDKFLPISGSAKKKLELIINPLLEKMELSDRGLGIFVKWRDNNVHASTDQCGRRPVLIVSLGFLKFLETHPSEASGLLAHELAHVDHKDVHLFKLFTSYVRAAFLIVFPFALVFAAINTVGGLVALDDISHTLMWDSAYQYPRFRYGYDDSDLTFDVSKRRRRLELENVVSERRRRLENVREQVYWKIALGFEGPIVALFVLTRLRKARRRAELAADLGAALHVGPESILAAVQSLAARHKRKHWLFSFHPTANLRLRNLARFYEAA